MITTVSTFLVLAASFTTTAPAADCADRVNRASATWLGADECHPTVEIGLPHHRNAMVETTNAHTTQNEEPKLISSTVRTWDGTDNPGKFVSRGEWDYDADGNTIESSSYRWDEFSKQWVGESRTTRVFEDGLERERASYQWDSLRQDWIGQWKMLTAYNSVGDVILRDQFEFNVQTGSWSAKFRNIFSYENGRISSGTSQHMDAWGEWINSSRHDYQYDSEGRNTSTIIYQWNSARQEFAARYRYLDIYEGETTFSYQEALDEESGEWIRRSSTRTDMVVDDLGRIISQLFYQWDPAEDKWVGQSGTLYSWNESGKLIEVAWVEWNNEFNDFRTTFREEFKYRSGDIIIEYTLYGWSESIQEFVEVYRNTYEYDAAGLNTDSYYYIQDDETQELIPSTHTKKEYSNTETSIATQIDPTSFELEQNYPNPFSGSSTLSFALDRPMRVRLTVYDVQGREVSRLVDEDREPGVHQIMFDGSGLSSGTYFARMEAGQRIRTVPMLLVK